MYLHFQQCPVILAGNKEQHKKYLGRLIEEPLVAVSDAFLIYFFVNTPRILNIRYS